MKYPYRKRSWYDVNGTITKLIGISKCEYQYKHRYCKGHCIFENSKERCCFGGEQPIYKYIKMTPKKMQKIIMERL